MLKYVLESNLNKKSIFLCKRNNLIKILISIICFTLFCILTNNINASTENNEKIAKDNYIKNDKLTYRTEENGETLISGFKIGEKVSEIVKGKFKDSYEIKIIDNNGKDITKDVDKKIGTGNKIELYSKTVGVRDTETRKNIHNCNLRRYKWRCRCRSSRCINNSKK